MGAMQVLQLQGLFIACANLLIFYRTNPIFFIIIAVCFSSAFCRFPVGFLSVLFDKYIQVISFKTNFYARKIACQAKYIASH